MLDILAEVNSRKQLKFCFYCDSCVTLNVFSRLQIIDIATKSEEDKRGSATDTHTCPCPEDAMRHQKTYQSRQNLFFFQETLCSRTLEPGPHNFEMISDHLIDQKKCFRRGVPDTPAGWLPNWNTLHSPIEQLPIQKNH